MFLITGKRTSIASTAQERKTAFSHPSSRSSRILSGAKAPGRHLIDGRHLVLGSEHQPVSLPFTTRARLSNQMLCAVLDSVVE